MRTAGATGTDETDMGDGHTSLRPLWVVVGAGGWLVGGGVCVLVLLCVGLCVLCVVCVVVWCVD